MNKKDHTTKGNKMIRHGFFDQYTSHDSEQSLFKNMPMDLRHHPFIKGMCAVGCRVVYRGPRTNQGTNGTLKRDATAFSIYPPSQRFDHELGKIAWPWESDERTIAIRWLSEL